MSRFLELFTLVISGKIEKRKGIQIRICRGNEQCMDKMKSGAGSLLTSG